MGTYPEKMEEESMARVMCPTCGTTINLENRRKIDFSLILNALRKRPKTFTNLLHLTKLPRKTLSLRLKALCNSEVISKRDGHYRLNDNSALKSLKLESTFGRRDKDLKKVIEAICLGFIVCLFTASLASALIPTIDNELVPLPPITSFTISPDSPYYVGWGENLKFDASLSYDIDGNITTYDWAFGDNFLGNGVITTHRYKSPGKYRVELTVTDDTGMTNKASRVITVMPTPCMKVYVDTPNVTDLTVGDIFTVNIAISNVTNLRAWQLGLTFNPDVLECMPVEISIPSNNTSVIQRMSAFQEGPFLKQGGETLFVSPKPVYEKEGVIRLHGCCIFDRTTGNSTSVSGSGTLTSITFKIISLGTSILHITNVKLLDNDVRKIPILSVEDGYFQLP